jgi:hypothetical protein
MSEIFDSAVAWSQRSWLGATAREVFWVFPLAEIFHFFGLCLLMGAVIVMDLRLLGWLKRMPLPATVKLVPAAMIGLAINLTSGIVFLCAYPENYWPSGAFRLKLLAIGIGAANAVWFRFYEEPRLLTMPDDARTDVRTRLVAGFSLFIWVAVIVLGRFLPFVSKSSS